MIKRKASQAINILDCFHIVAKLNKAIDVVRADESRKMKKVAKTLRNHKDIILNWFWAKKQFSSGVVEGLNTKVKLTIRKSFSPLAHVYRENLVITGNACRCLDLEPLKRDLNGVIQSRLIPKQNKILEIIMENC